MTVITEQQSLLWLGGAEVPDNVRLATGERWDVVPCASDGALPERLNAAGVVLVAPTPDEPVDHRRLSALLDEIDRSQAVAVVLLPRRLPEGHRLTRRRGQYVLLPADAPPAKLAASIDAAAALQPAIKNLQTDVAAIRSFGRGMPHELEEVDEELRLAARLQRDFLPRRLPQVPPIRFATLFRPAGWVSGDIYDVFRLDEAHVGFYVADVVGHGMPAALLTMFVKKALQTKRIFGSSYEIVAPEQALAQLNADLCDQGLTSCQFCTAVYGIVHTGSLEVRYARAGHPAPLLLPATGEATRLDAVGSLLGVFPDEAFQAGRAQLAGGDRLVTYSDGLEETLCPDDRPCGRRLVGQLRSFRKLGAEEMSLQLARRIDDSRAVNHRGDDITVLVMDVAAD